MRLFQADYLTSKRTAFFAVAVAVAAAAWSYSNRPIAHTNPVATCTRPAAQIVPTDWPNRNALLAGWDTIRTDVPVPRFIAGGSGQIDNLAENTLYVDRRGPLQSLGDVEWDTEEHGLYYATQLHGLVGLGAAFEETERLSEQVEQAIGNHILNWGYCAGHNPYINSRAWYEGTVIKRQSNLLRALQHLRGGGHLGDLSREQLLYLIDANAAYLLDTNDVYTLDNHGIRQDMLLAATALVLPDHPRAEEMLDLAEGRLETAGAELFTPNGIWKEHAPGYVNYALGLIEEIRALHDASPDFNPRLFLSRYQSSREYLLTSLLPDGTIPYVGASGASKVRVASQAEINDFLAARARSLAAFPDYGHAIVRGDHPDGLYLLFVAGQNLPAGKRHSDELSFLLYNFGRPWITEGGHQSYELSGMYRYLRSPLAHNTYALNGEYLVAEDSPELDVELVSAERDEDVVRLRGRSERFVDSAAFERTIEIDDYSRLTISDVLTGEGSWEGRLQLPGDLEVEIDGNVVTAIDTGGRAMVISFSADKPISISTCRGTKKPICGWAKPAHEFGSASTLMWSFEGSTRIAARIAWHSDLTHGR